MITTYATMEKDSKDHTATHSNICQWLRENKFTVSTIDDFMQFLNEMKTDRRELFSLLHKLALKSKVISSVEFLKLFLCNYKQDVNECGQKPENIMKLLEEVNKRLRN